MQPSHIVKGERKEKGAWLSLLQRAGEQQVPMGQTGVRASRGEQLVPDSNPVTPVTLAPLLSCHEGCAAVWTPQ